MTTKNLYMALSHLKNCIYFIYFIEIAPNVQLILVHYDSKIVLLNNDLLFCPIEDSWSEKKITVHHTI